MIGTYIIQKQRMYEVWDLAAIRLLELLIISL